MFHKSPLRRASLVINHANGLEMAGVQLMQFYPTTAASEQRVQRGGE